MTRPGVRLNSRDVVLKNCRPMMSPFLAQIHKHVRKMLQRDALMQFNEARNSSNGLEDKRRGSTDGEPR